MSTSLVGLGIAFIPTITGVFFRSVLSWQHHLIEHEVTYVLNGYYESHGYEIKVSEPLWRLSPEEEMQQHEANAEAMRAFIERTAGTLDPREEACVSV